MKAMRASSRYGGSAASSRRPPTVKTTTAEPQPMPDSDSEEDRLPRRMQAASIRPRTARDRQADEEEEMQVEEAPDDMSGFNMPMSFGKQKPKKAPVADVHSSNQRKGRGVPAAGSKPGGVQFGPRVTDAAVAAGARGRAEKAEVSSSVEQPAEEASGKSVGPVGPVEDAGGDEAPDDLPEPGKESEVLPVSHEVAIPAHTKAVTAMTLDPKASRMITGGMDGSIKLFDFHGMSEAKEAFRELEPVENHLVQSVSYSTTGGSFLAVCSDSTARIYDRDGSSQMIQSTVKGDMYVRHMEHTKGHTQTLTDGMWHPFRQEHFLTSSLDGTLRIWDMNADPVGMDQQLPSVHVLKTLDRRNVCVGGGCGKTGGLYPTCCTYSPTDAKKIVGGCSDGSVQVFFEKARYMKPDRILRNAHSAQVTGVGFIPEGAESNLLVTRSMDNTMKVWDCRMLSDAKGPVKVFEDLTCTHEKTGLCASPDGRHFVTGTSLSKGAMGSAVVRVYETKSLELVKTLDFGKKSVLRLCWPKELNQLIVGTSTGEVTMLYSPFSSKKGALHFVGKKAKVKSQSQAEDVPSGPIFNMTDPAEIQKFYSTGHGDMTKIRRTEARAGNKAMAPTRPEDSGTKMPNQAFGDFAALALKVGAKRLNLNSTRITETDSQTSLLKYQDKVSSTGSSLVDGAYSKTQPDKLLDFSTELSEGDARMHEAMKGEFCRKCGMKQCRCVDYSKYGLGSKKPRIA